MHGGRGGECPPRHDPGWGTLAVPSEPQQHAGRTGRSRQNLQEFDEIIEELLCRAVLFGLGSLDFLVFQIIVV